MDQAQLLDPPDQFHHEVHAPVHPIRIMVELPEIVLTVHPAHIFVNEVGLAPQGADARFDAGHRLGHPDALVEQQFRIIPVFAGPGGPEIAPESVQPILVVMVFDHQFIAVHTDQAQFAFEVVLDDKPLRFGRKAQQKPIDLVQVLVALGGRKIAETKIADILWPDDDGDMQIKSLHTTVYRLRKLLGYKDAIEYEDSRLSLNDKICWVDVWAFERLLGEAETMFRGKPTTQKVKHLKEKQFSLYQNALLHQLTDRYWTIQLREKLKSKFLRAIEQLGNYYLKTGCHEEVISLHRKALEVDPLLESSYQQIMLSYIKLGKTSEAANTYRTCARVLRNSLGVEPSEETRKIYKQFNKTAKKK